MSNTITGVERMRLEEVFQAGAAQIHEADEHWLGGDNADQSISYCYDCALKEIEKRRRIFPGFSFWVDGGWGVEGDSTPFCCVCNQLLENTLTNYGCEAELDHYLYYGLDPMSPFDCLMMIKVLDSRGWDVWGLDDDMTGYDYNSSVAYHNNLYRLCRIIIDNNFWIMPDNDYRHMWQ